MDLILRGRLASVIRTAIPTAAIFLTFTVDARADEVLPTGTEAATAPPPSTDATAVPTAPPAVPAAAPATDKATPADSKWYDRLEWSAFVDTYASINYKVRPITGANKYRAFDTNNGLSLAWIGADVVMEPDPIGVNIGLRMGPSVPNLALNDAVIAGGIANLQNAYLSWKPKGKSDRLTLIAGKFDTLYGAEVPLSHQNINYTRGLLYNLGQPFFHTGVRADYQATDAVAIKVLAVNGWNNTVDNNTGKSLGAQVTLTPSDTASILIGYLGGPEQAELGSVVCAGGTAFDAVGQACTPSVGAPGGTFATRNTGANSRWRHMADLVVDLKPTSKLRLVANGTYVAEAVPGLSGDGVQRWYGAELMARYAFTDVFAGAVRGEVFVDDDGFATATAAGTTLESATLTLEAAPSRYLLVRLDNRVDAATNPIFVESVSGTGKNQFTTTLGIVAKTN